MEFLTKFTGFDWDKGNRDKSWIKHRVSNSECEEVFFNLPLLVTPDQPHSGQEDRYYVLGRTNGGILLFVVITPKGEKIRVISARGMTRKEKRIYDEAEKENP